MPDTPAQPLRRWHDFYLLFGTACRHPSWSDVCGHLAWRYERCRLVVENSYQLGEWEKNPSLPGADPVGLQSRSFAALAQLF